MSLGIHRNSMPRDLSLDGELDLATSPELVRILGTISSRGDITLDLSLLRFVDLSGFRVFASTAGRLAGSLVLASPPPVLVRMMEILRCPIPPNLALRVPDARDSVTTAVKPDSATA